MSDTITSTYNVVGIHCGGCATKITNAVVGVEGVVGANVEVSNGTLEVSGHPDEAAIRAAVADLGYQIAD
jgi:copper chaperone CopZ